MFEETIAFSFSGGQESDKAIINDMPVLSSYKEDNLIYYELPENHGLKVGDTVNMKIDWTRRLKLMRLHFTAELVLEIVTKKYKLEKVGAHITEDKSRIDFTYSHNISHLFEEILTEYNKIIESDLVIKTDFSDVENQRRYWEIDGFSKVPCGGIHVSSTKEVGFVKLKRKI